MGKTFLHTAIVGIGKIYEDGHEPIYKHGGCVAPIAFVDWDEKRAKNKMKNMKKVVDKAAKNGEEWAEAAKHQMKVYTDFGKMLSELEGVVELVDNCTHGEYHVPLSIQALEHNVNVMCEKPPALNWYQLKKLVETENKSKVHYQLNENVCYDKSIMAAKNAIASNLLGDIVEIEIQFGHGGPYWPYVVDKEGLPHFISPLLSGGGCLQDLAPHGISKAFWPIGEGAKILRGKCDVLERRDAKRKMSGKLVDPQVDDHASGKFIIYDPRTKKEFPMKITTSWCGGFAFPFHIEGTKGLLHPGFNKKENANCPVIEPEDGDEEIYVDLPQDNFHKSNDKIREVQIFVDNILKGQRSFTDSVYALRLEEIISMHYFSKMKGREVTIEEMDNWGSEIETKNGNDWQKTVNAICLEFQKAITILK
jgi:predicted dehydrogenase